MIEAAFAWSYQGAGRLAYTWSDLARHSTGAVDECFLVRRDIKPIEWFRMYLTAASRYE